MVLLSSSLANSFSYGFSGLFDSLYHVVSSLNSLLFYCLNGSLLGSNFGFCSLVATRCEGKHTGNCHHKHYFLHVCKFFKG